MRGTFLILIVLLAIAFRATAADEWPPVYSIPELTDITIDGDGGDWKDQGFRIEALAPADGKIVPSTDFDALVRLAWCKDGLLVLISVVDPTPVEKENRDQLEQGDSVELFVEPDNGGLKLRYASPLISKWATTCGRRLTAICRSIGGFSIRNAAFPKGNPPNPERQLTMDNGPLTTSPCNRSSRSPST
jgi:hypothetical protein